MKSNVKFAPLTEHLCKNSNWYRVHYSRYVKNVLREMGDRLHGMDAIPENMALMRDVLISTAPYCAMDPARGNSLRQNVGYWDYVSACLTVLELLGTFPLTLT